MYPTQFDWTGVQAGFSLCIILIAVLIIWLDVVISGRKKLGSRFETTQGKLTRAELALLRAGFRDLGGETWAPPIGPRPDALLQRISDLEAELDMTKKQRDEHQRKYYNTPVAKEREQFLWIIRTSYVRAIEHQSKQVPKRIRSGADACRFIAENMREVIDKYGKTDTAPVAGVSHG
jgi:hypothetical protein